MTTLVFGKGFLGRRLATSIPGSYLSSVDITNQSSVEREIDYIKPTAIINAAGKTGRPNVDWCEHNRVETFQSNTVGPLVLAKVCAKARLYLLHLASGCIFYGDSPIRGGWLETDTANPSSFYSRTKYAADLVLSQMPNVGIARLRMPIDSVPGPRNLITKLAAYKQVIDVENSVTIVKDLVKVVTSLLEKRAEGVFHVTNPGTMRHRDMLALYKEIVDPAHEYELLSEKKLIQSGTILKPRSNCILASPRLEQLGLTMPHIDQALRQTMLEYKYYCTHQ